MTRPPYELCGGSAGILDASMFDVFPSLFETEIGKFVVVDGLILVGPDSGAFATSTNNVHHGNIVAGYFEAKGETDLLNRASIDYANNQELCTKLGIQDTGSVQFARDSFPRLLEIFGKSGSFYETPLSNRNMTLLLAQERLGGYAQAVLRCEE